MNWTEKQLKTIETHGKNVLVSAAAGSGKTAVLTERILRLITKCRVPIKELLVVTFTEAAASEMKSRISAALELVSESNSFAEKQLRQLSSARIMTFHAFCLTILKRYYYVIDLDPSFSVADDRRIETLKEEALDEVIAGAFSDPDEAFRDEYTKFLNAYADVRSEKKVRSMILRAYEYIMTLPDPFGWLDDSVYALLKAADDLNEAPAVRFANNEIEYMLSLARLLTEQTGAALTSLDLTGLAAKNASDLEKISQIEKSFISEDRESTRTLIDELTFEVFRAGKEEKDAYEDVKEIVKLRRDRVKEIMKKHIGSVFFSQMESVYADEIKHISPYALTLVSLVRRFSESFTRIKRAEKIIDFDDFEHMALKILENEDIANSYKRRLSYIFVDEYQDSNYVQEALISNISRGDNVFMVGDVKQSIYSFRNAAPEIFLEKIRRFSAFDSEDTPDLRIDLSNNYRSKARVIEAVNAVFETLMDGHYSGLEYDDDVRLVTGVVCDPEAEGTARMHLIKKDAAREFVNSDSEGEAALCAEIINDTVGKQFYDVKRGVWRTVRYSDIAVLLRTAKNTSDIYRKTLENRGIPAVTDRGEGYFEKVEIDTFLSLLRAIVNLRRDVPLASAMFSVVFGFELSELAVIRSYKQDGFFYTAFLEYAGNGSDPDLREKCASAAERLSVWRDEERFMRLDDFLWKVMLESGFYSYAGDLPGGALRQANLRALLDRAAGFQSGKIEGLRGFLSYLEKIKDRGGAAQVTLLTGDEDVCRIMTIHGSKGLEFPFVILGGLGKTLLRGGMGDDSLLLQREAGLSLQWRDPETHTYKNTLIHKALKLKQAVNERAEAIRLLYVGMTRAMDTLHMIGTVRDPEKLTELYGNDITSPDIDTDVFGASNYMEMLLPTIMKRKDLFGVNVTETERFAKGASPDDKDKVIADRQDNISQEPFIYPYAIAAKLKSKYSVTELSRADGESGIRGSGPFFFMSGGKDETDEDAGLADADRSAPGLTAAEKGLALHKAFELLDIKEAYANRDDPEWFEKYTEPKTIEKFANSKLAERAARSVFLMKEAPFNMMMPYSEALREPAGSGARTDDEEIVIQGIIDCLFEEEDELVVFDYKSGWFDTSNYESESERIRSLYGAQLRLYRRAAELIFGKPVKETLIYLTNAGVTVGVR